MSNASKEIATGEIEPSRIQGIPLDVLLLLFEQLTEDTRTLCAIGLACRDFRRLSLPFLLRDVDISSHNNRRVPEHDNIMVREAYADYDGDYRPENLVPRQHAFLHLLKDRPELAPYVRRFTWTLVWGEIEELVAKTSGNKDAGALSQKIMRSTEAETWSIFSRMMNVRDLDLASLHHVAVASIVRDNPPKLFPAVTELRLVGWMHRGLASAIITTLDPKQLL
ncbi:hypothetical protein CKM354_000727300 [Cercospora kikuchii]|uniref:F-box domain-containing protein n=1 Tax=Cercospora kikuchii TaxID=84275 RepID=A0A9P3CGR6_9PEZI|nr:uncharacterized protein CKM354_000727300 [Cercospora kikuchii]GIZ44064.1 hypothetical protein CKM354_000727300 [Cercospora kikuchii]